MCLEFRMIPTWLPPGFAKFGMMLARSVLLQPPMLTPMFGDNGWRTQVLCWTSPDFGPSIHDGLGVTVFDYSYVRISRRMQSAQPANYPCCSFEMSLSLGLWNPEVAQPALGKRLP